MVSENSLDAETTEPHKAQKETVLLLQLLETVMINTTKEIHLEENLKTWLHENTQTQRVTRRWKEDDTRGLTTETEGA